MVRLPSSGAKPLVPNPTAVNLVRMLVRFQQILIAPDSETEARLRVSAAERAKVGANLEHARQLLSRLEQQAQTIAITSSKQEMRVDFARTRSRLQSFAERLQQLKNLAEYEDDLSDEEDLLGVVTPAEETIPNADLNSTCPSLNAPHNQETTASIATSSTSRASIVAEETGPTSVPESVLRARHQAERAQPLAPLASTTGANVDGTAETLLTHNRTEQENLTAALLEMARTLKSSSQAFSRALEEEKDILGHATKGMSKNELALEAAQRRMGLLRTMTEGKGWWGRMMMYVWIAALALVAFLIVFLMPKLRF